MRFIFLLLSIILSPCLFGQRICGSHEYALHAGLYNNHTYNNQPTSNPSTYSRDTVADEIITIPVVIHVLYHTASENISDAQIMSQLKVMNDDFRRLNADASQTPVAFLSKAADSRIMFCLAQVNPRGEVQRGIIRKYTAKTGFTADDAMKFNAGGGDDAWDTRKYLNIWVCNFQNSLLGYATQPGGQSDKDGIVIQYDAFGTVGTVRSNFDRGRTVIHELGHWMGLKHIWGDNDCGDDGVDDTPRQSGYNRNCPNFPQMSSCSPDNNGDMFMNFMDYTNDACMNMFTEGQKIKMRSVFAINRYRNSILMSFACDSSLATAAPLPVDSIPAVTSSKTVQIFPNPVQNELNLISKDGYELSGKSVIIASTAGVVVLKNTIISNNTSFKLNLTGLQPGLYIISIGQGTDKRVLKLIKV